MNCLDSSFLVDYLNGKSAVGAQLEDRPAGSFYVPTIVLFELFKGVGADEIDEIAGAIDWATPLPLTAAAAREAAEINHELASQGTPINQFDVLIAGVVRAVGGTLLTRDRYFQRVTDLDVEIYELR